MARWFRQLAFAAILILICFVSAGFSSVKVKEEKSAKIVVAFNGGKLCLTRILEAGIITRGRTGKKCLAVCAGRLCWIRRRAFLRVKTVKATKANPPARGTYKVFKNNRTVFTFIVGPFSAIEFFASPAGKWILEYNNGKNDRVAVNGKYIGRKRYKHVFNYKFFNSKPFYFFEKNEKTYLSYNGGILNTSYERVFRGGCCDNGIFNPVSTNKYLGFFAKKNGYWYYVEVFF